MPTSKKSTAPSVNSSTGKQRRRKHQTSRNARIGRDPASRKQARRSVKPAKSLSDSESVFRRINTVKRKLQSLEAGYHKRLHASLTSLYATAIHLYEHQEAWEQFCLDERWLDKAQHKRKPKPDKQDDALRFVLRLALSGSPQQVNDKSSKYFRALEASWDKKVTANRVRGQLEKHGIEGLVAQRKMKDAVKNDKIDRKPKRKAEQGPYTGQGRLKREWPPGHYTGSAEVYIDKKTGARKVRFEMIPR